MDRILGFQWIGKVKTPMAQCASKGRSEPLKSLAAPRKLYSNAWSAWAIPQAARQTRPGRMAGRRIPGMTWARSKHCGQRQKVQDGVVRRCRIFGVDQHWRAPPMSRRAGENRRR